MREELNQTLVDPPRVILEIATADGDQRILFSAGEILRGVRIGTRRDCELRLEAGDDPLISPVHATLKDHEGVVFVRDEDSEHGVFLNGVRVHYPGAPVKTGARLSLGKDGPCFVVSIPGQPISTLPGLGGRGSAAPAPDARAETLLGVSPAAAPAPAAPPARPQPAALGQTLIGVPAPELPKPAPPPEVGQTLLGTPDLPRPELTSEDDPAQTIPRPAANGPPRVAPAPVPRSLPGVAPLPGDPVPEKAARPVPAARPEPKPEAPKPQPRKREAAEPPLDPAQLNDLARAYAEKVGAGARTIRLLNAVAGQVEARSKKKQSVLARVAAVLGVLVLLVGAAGGVYYWRERGQRIEATTRAWEIHESRQREREDHKQRIEAALAELKRVQEDAARQREEYEGLKAKADQELLLSMVASEEQKIELERRLAEEARARSLEIKQLALKQAADDEAAIRNGKDKAPSKAQPPSPPKQPAAPSLDPPPKRVAGGAAGAPAKPKP